MAYEAFADIYDAFNEDADYTALHTYLRARLEAHGIRSGIVADLGCGTGDLTLRLAQDGYDMIGVDRSEEMLSVLREKAFEQHVEGLLLLRQDLERLDLYGTVRAAVSTFDTFNHIGPFPRFAAALARCALFVEPGGLFLFDLNTPYKHEQVLADNVYLLEAEDVTCRWENRWDAARRCTQITVDMSYPGQPEHEVECFTEYAYSLEEIQQACEDAGLRIEAVCDGERFAPLRPDSERYLITAVKTEDRNCNREENGNGKIDPRDL